VIVCGERGEGDRERKKQQHRRNRKKDFIILLPLFLQNIRKKEFR
jgi:hypothetical protein